MRKNQWVELNGAFQEMDNETRRAILQNTRCGTVDRNEFLGKIRRVGKIPRGKGR